MNNATKEKKNRKGKSVVRTPAGCVSIALAGLVLASGIALFPEGGAQVGTNTEWSVNNMHCGHNIEGGFKAAKSGPPHHDNVEPATNARGDCTWVGADTGEAYSVATPLDSPQLHGELYLQSPDGIAVEGTVCLQYAENDDPNPPMTDWSCGPVERTTRTTTPAYWWKSESTVLPSTLVPIWRQFRVGVAEEPDDCCVFDGPTSDKSGFGTVRFYNGNTVTAANITDPGGDNVHLDFTDFKSWVIHDPEEDDEITIGGTTTRWDPGSALDLLTHDTRIEYDESSEGGNEWTITSISGDDTVYVWLGSGGWSIVELSY